MTVDLIDALTAIAATAMAAWTCGRVYERWSWSARGGRLPAGESPRATESCPDCGCTAHVVDLLEDRNGAPLAVTQRFACGFARDRCGHRTAFCSRADTAGAAPAGSRDRTAADILPLRRRS